MMSKSGQGHVHIFIIVSAKTWYYETEREKFLLYIKFDLLNLKLLSPNELFITLMTSESAFLLKFVECIWMKRKTFLEN